MTEETTRELNGLHRKQRRRAWLGAAAAILAGVLVGGTGTALVSAVNREEQKAEQAVSAVDQLCGQVRALGGVCVVDPEDLRGEEGRPDRRDHRVRLVLPGLPGSAGCVGQSGIAGQSGPLASRGSPE